MADLGKHWLLLHESCFPQMTSHITLLYPPTYFWEYTGFSLLVGWFVGLGGLWLVRQSASGMWRKLFHSFEGTFLT